MNILTIPHSVKIGTKFSILITLSFLFIMSAIGYYTVNMQQGYISTHADNQMQEEMNDLYNILDMQISGNQEKVNISLNLAHNYLYSLGDITIQNQTVQYDAVNQITNQTTPVTVPVWTIGGRQIQNDKEIVDSIKKRAVETVTIFQKIEPGYLRISTNVMKGDGTRAIGTYIPNSSEVIQTVEQGDTYRGRAFVVNDWYLTAYEPIIINGQVRGILYVGVREKNMTLLRSIFSKKTYYDNGYPFLISDDGTMLIHPTQEGENVSSADFFTRMTASQSRQGKLSYTVDDTEKILYYRYYKPINAYVAATFNRKDSEVLSIQTRNTIIVTITIGIVIFIGVVLLVTRSVTVPLRTVKDLVHEVSLGNLNNRYTGRLSGDEIGDMVYSINQMIDQLTTTVGAIVQSSTKINQISDEFSQTAMRMSEGANEQAANIEEITSSLEEMSASISHNNQNAKKTDTLAQNTSLLAEEGGAAVQQTVSAMKEITDIITVIEDIAYQTNLLALNAAIEAARAGENGKGFSIVASEVRKLSEKSQEALQKISNVVHESLTIAESAGNKIEQIVLDTKKTADNVQTIAHASEEQDLGVQQINTGTEQLNDISQTSAEAAENLAEKAQYLQQTATSLMELISYFDITDTTGQSGRDS
ncbi:MAG: methyl-accepting chemotaxis protein [Spirochaetota bacterium]